MKYTIEKSTILRERCDLLSRNFLLAIIFTITVYLGQKVLYFSCLNNKQTGKSFFYSWKPGSLGPCQCVYRKEILVFSVRDQ